MHPDTLLRVLGPEPWNVVYVQPSRRPADARYGENPFRLGKHYQLQVILKPAPKDVQELYVKSLEAIGVDLSLHDLRFEEDNWEAPTLGAWGLGWQVMLDGMEITQFTYFQQAGGLELKPISAELTYGLERITMFLGSRAASTTSIGWPVASTTARSGIRTSSSSPATTSKWPTSSSCSSSSRATRGRPSAVLTSGLVLPGLRVCAEVLAPVQRHSTRRARYR